MLKRNEQMLRHNICLKNRIQYFGISDDRISRSNILLFPCDFVSSWNYDCNQDERNDEMSKCMR